MSEPRDFSGLTVENLRNIITHQDAQLEGYRAALEKIQARTEHLIDLDNVSADVYWMAKAALQTKGVE